MGIKLKNGLRLVLINFLIIVMIGALFVTPAGAQEPPDDVPWVEPALLAQSKRTDSLSYIITFDDQADLSAAYTMSWEARGWYVYETLTTHAEKTQARVQHFLDQRGVTYTSFFAGNMILVEESNGVTLNGLLNFTEIEALQTLPEVMLMEPVTTTFYPTGINQELSSASTNLQRIRAPQVWDMGITGEGIVVGSIDTGVRYTHQALVAQYRGNLGGSSFNHNYSWWDPEMKSSTPFDDHGHGTHVTGIMVGDDGGSNQIGVAPGAQWIACKGFDSEGRGTGVLQCGDFMLAPWDLSGKNPNPSLRPHVVNNSWGDGSESYHSFFQSIVNAWLAAGIYPLFANGNSGPGLGTVGNPARYGNVTGVGATSNNTGQLAGFSSWGPTDNADTVNPNGYPYIKPQVVAPGVSIRSAHISNNTSYALSSGTSMATPHVAGLVALIWDYAACLVGDYARTETLIQDTATPIPYATGNGDEGPGNVPNHATGWGEINAEGAVNLAGQICSRPNINGFVLDAYTNKPIKNAQVVISGGSLQRNGLSTQSHPSGYYVQTVATNQTFSIHVKADGYVTSDIIGDIKLEPDESMGLNFYLQRDLKYFFLPLVLR